MVVLAYSGIRVADNPPRRRQSLISSCEQEKLKLQGGLFIYLMKGKRYSKYNRRKTEQFLSMLILRYVVMISMSTGPDSICKTAVFPLLYFERIFPFRCNETLVSFS